MHHGQVSLRARQCRIDERAGQHPAGLGRQHHHDCRELRTLRPVHRDRPAVGEISQRLAANLRWTRGELDGDRAVAIDLGYPSDLAVRVAERLGLEMIGRGHDAVTRVEPSGTAGRD